VDSSAWDERYAGSDLVWSAGPNQWVEAVTRNLRPGRALDVAAGEGRNAIWLAERGWDVVATDFSAVAVDRIRALAAQRLGDDVDRLTAHVSDATHPHPDQHAAFDLVIVSYLQLVPGERSLALAEAARAVAPGGVLVVTAHDSRNLVEGHGGPQHPDVLYGPEEVVADIGASGLVVQRAETVVREVRNDEDDGRPHRALDVLVTARRDA
jgi:SAM-dependent methyltransferase